MKKIVSLLICLALVLGIGFVMTGCKDGDTDTANAGKKEAPSIVAKWEATVDCTNAVKEKLATVNHQMADYFDFDGLTVKYSYVFDKEGNYVLSVDSKTFDKQTAKIKSSAKKAVVSYLEDIIKAHGENMTPEEMCKQSDNMTLDEVCEDFLNKWDIASCKPAASKGKYKLDGDKLYIGENEQGLQNGPFYTVGLESNKLTLKEYSIKDNSRAENKLLPIIFKKIK